jgi:hypothetical protein
MLEYLLSVWDDIVRDFKPAIVTVKWIWGWVSFLAVFCWNFDFTDFGWPHIMFIIEYYWYCAKWAWPSVLYWLEHLMKHVPFICQPNYVYADSVLDLFYVKPFVWLYDLSIVIATHIYYFIVNTQYFIWSFPGRWNNGLKWIYSIIYQFNWEYFLSDVWFIQVSILYVLYLVYTANNYYLTLFYFLICFFYYGFFLCFYQLDFFVGFLWLTECLVVFVLILMLFYLANSGNFNKFKQNLLIFFHFSGALSILLLSTNFIIFSETEWFLPMEFAIVEIWDDFYELWNNSVMNDAVGLMISYYLVNSFEFLCITFFLLVGSLIVVNLNQIFKKVQYPLYNSFLEILTFLNEWVKSFFLRKQNLTDQESTRANTRQFVKK